MDNNLYVDSLHAKMHEVFKAAIDFMESHSLMWFVSGGTAIGAIRHHDFIPWDDDIDIYMPRNDYNKLLSLKNDIESSTGLELLDIDDEGYTQWFAKFVDKSSTTVESMSNPRFFGVWVDVFPLDYSSRAVGAITIASKEYKDLFLDYQRSLFPINIRRCISDLLAFRFYSLYKTLSNHFSKRRRDCLKMRFKSFEASIIEERGNFIVSYCEGGRIMNPEWFDTSEWVEFNDYRVRVPIGYDAYLASVFGDYMSLPPEESRITHRLLYLNLRERLNNKQIKTRIKNRDNYSNDYEFFSR